MTPFIANVLLSALSTIATTPQVEPDPALIAQLEQERPVAVGKNGADALFALPKVPTVPALQCQNVFIVSASAVNYRHEQKNLPKRYQSRAICASPSPAGKCP